MSDWKKRAIPAPPVEGAPPEADWKSRAIPAPGLDGLPPEAPPDDVIPGLLEAHARAAAEGYTGGLSGRIAGLYGVADELGKRAGATTYPEGVPARQGTPLVFTSKNDREPSAFDTARQVAEVRRWSGDQAHPSTVATEVIASMLNPIGIAAAEAAPVMRMLPNATRTALQVAKPGVQSALKSAVNLADNVVVPGAVQGALASYGRGELADVPLGLALGGGGGLALVGATKGAGLALDVARNGAARLLPEQSKAVADWLRSFAINRFKKGAGAIQSDLAVYTPDVEREDRLVGQLLDSNRARPGDTPKTLLPKFEQMADEAGRKQGELERAVDDAAARKVGLPSGDIQTVRAERLARRNAAQEASQDALLLQQERLRRAFESTRNRLEGDLQQLQDAHTATVKQLEQAIAAAEASGQQYSGRLQAEQAALQQQLAAIEEAAAQRSEQLKQVAAQQQEALSQALARSEQGAAEAVAGTKKALQDTIATKSQEAQTATERAVASSLDDLTGKAQAVDEQKRLLTQKLANTLDVLEGRATRSLSADDQVAASVGAIPREQLITRPFNPTQVNELGNLVGKSPAEQARGIEALAADLIARGDKRAAAVGRLVEDQEVRQLAGMSEAQRRQAVAQLARARNPARQPELDEELRRVAALPRREQKAALEQLAKMRAPVQPDVGDELKRIAVLPAKERKEALAKLAQQMAELEVPPTATEGIQPEVLQLMGAGKREQAAGVQALAEARVPKPPELDAELEAARRLSDDKRAAVLAEVARRRMPQPAPQVGAANPDPALLPLIGRDPRAQQAGVESIAQRRVVYPEPKAPPVSADEVLFAGPRPTPKLSDELRRIETLQGAERQEALANLAKVAAQGRPAPVDPTATVGLDVRPVLEKMRALLPRYDSYADEANQRYLAKTIGDIEEQGTKGLTASRLREMKTAITDNINYGKEPSRAEELKRQVASLFDDLVESEVRNQKGQAGLDEYRKLKDEFGAAALGATWASRGKRRAVGNRIVSATDHIVGSTAAQAAPEDMAGVAKAALGVAFAAGNNALRKQNMSWAIGADRLSKYLRAEASAGPATSAMFNEYGPTLQRLQLLSRTAPTAAAVEYYLLHKNSQRFRELDEQAQKETSTPSP